MVRLENNHSPFIWAHRGASGHEIDNTMESFKLALEMGADGLESDVHQSKDNVLFLYHENRIQWDGKKVNPSRLTMEQLESINLGEGRKIPRVRDVFEYFKEKSNKAGQEIRYSLDVKRLKMAPPLAKLAEDVAVAHNVEITPNDDWPRFWSTIEKIRKISSDIHIVDSAHFGLKPLKMLFKRMFYQNWEKFDRYNVKGVNVKAALASDDLIRSVKNRNLKMYVWDCHDRETLETFMPKSIDAVYSNYPDVANHVRKSIFA